MCSFTVTHFSTFAVGDAAVINPVSSSAVPTSSSSPNIGAIAGGIAGAILLAIVTVFVVMKIKKRVRAKNEESRENSELVKEDANL
jgi:hypothetical protein